MVDSHDDLEMFRELERTRLEALVRADMAVAEALHADDYQLITPGGAALSKRESGWSCDTPSIEAGSSSC
jgi:Domain of unknown function (DUF4440)